MHFSVASLIALLAIASGVLSAPLTASKRQATVCFITGHSALPAEVATGIPAVARAVTCTTGTSVSSVPDVVSGGIDFKSIDFQKSSKSPLGFALQTFATPADPAKANLARLQNQLNVYLAVEAGIRSNSGTSSSLLNGVKSAKFFLQFQIVRVRTAQGAKLDAADTAEHQLAKVLKNAVGATSSEKAQVNALAKVL